MAVMFTPPEPPSAEIVQQECQAVVSQVVRMASKRVIDAHESKEGGGENSGDSPFSGGRHDAIAETALSIGAQAGLHWRYEQIDDLLDREAVQAALDAAFRFNRLVTKDNVLYPVISEARQSFSASADGQSARSSRLTWSIIKPARIVTAPPNWRTYLHQETSANYRAPSALMPYNKSEKQLWSQNICTGFTQGAQQADLIFSDRMTRLVRDYSGMLRYKMLETQQIVSAPEVVEGRLGVRMEADREKVFVDDRMIRITDPVQFKNVEDWDAIKSMELPDEAAPRKY